LQARCDLSSLTSFVAVDFETAGATRGTACALGWALVDGREISESGKELIDPNIPDDEWSRIKIDRHGIRPKDVRGAPDFGDAWLRLMDLADGRPLVAHYAAHDVGVIREEHDRSGRQITAFKFLCSVQLSRRAWPHLLSVSLPVVAEFLAIPLVHHDPQSDAEASANVAIEAIRVLAADTESSPTFWGQVSSDQKWNSFGFPVLKGTDKASGYRELGIEQGTDPDHPLHGQVIVFTGELQSMTRGIAHQFAYRAGATPGDNVTKATTMLVSGDQNVRSFARGDLKSSKFRKAQLLRAQGYDIQLLSEDDFLSLL
jgi:DNA polymerase III subunit epsilon